MTPPPPGAYIIATSPLNLDNTPPPYNGKTLSFLEGAFPAVIQLTGEVIGITGTTNTWTATNSSGTTATIGTGLSVSWSIPTSDLYTVTMTSTVSGGRVVGTATMFADVALRPR